MELSGAVVVVTGASAGIGRATALAFARKGSTLVLAARREHLLEDVAAEIRAHGRQALVVPCDVSRWDEVDALRSRTADAFGRCDVLVNNAGIPGGGPFVELSVEQIERIARVNYLGVLSATKAFLPMMLAERRGHVVNIASLAGRFAVPGASVYTSTKHAVVAFSEALHYEVAAQGLFVTAINPGLVNTEAFPHRQPREKGLRVMNPEDIARVVVRVVQRGIAPERSVPRWLASLQVFRVLTPPLYRFGQSRLVKRAVRPTRSTTP